jgi:Icc-related predicted phosphoesterase
MKILAFTDMHGSLKAFDKIKKKAKDVDIILNCGDFTIFQQKMQYFLKKFEGLKKPMLIVPGNHESEQDLYTACKGLKHVRCVIDEEVLFKADKKTIIILAAEGNGFQFKDPRFEEVAKKFKNFLKLKENKGKKIILMTHAPPYGTSLDKLMDGHTGNKSIKDFIKDQKPSYSFHGHIEENNGATDKIGKTVIINPGPEGKIIVV